MAHPGEAGGDILQLAADRIQQPGLDRLMGSVSSFDQENGAISDRLRDPAVCGGNLDVTEEGAGHFPILVLSQDKFLFGGYGG